MCTTPAFTRLAQSRHQDSARTTRRQDRDAGRAPVRRWFPSGTGAAGGSRVALPPSRSLSRPATSIHSVKAPELSTISKECDRSMPHASRDPTDGELDLPFEFLPLPGDPDDLAGEAVHQL